jgi:DNA-directed RNA polymerase subunit H (RpoH/RPB5)
MPSIAILLMLSLSLLSPQAQQNPAVAKQLLAVRGEVVSIKTQSKGMLLITVRPAKGFPEVTVLARENDLVGSAVSREEGIDVLGLLSDDERANEIITAAELNQGDIVSIIYDPQSQNRAIEIYLR